MDPDTFVTMLQEMVGRAREAMLGGGAPELADLLGAKGLGLLDAHLPGLAPEEAETAVRLLLSFYGRSLLVAVRDVPDRPGLRPHLDYMGALVRWRGNLLRWAATDPQDKFAALARADRLLRDAYARYEILCGRPGRPTRVPPGGTSVPDPRSLGLPAAALGPPPSRSPGITTAEAVALCRLAASGVSAAADFGPPEEYDWRKLHLAGLQSANRRRAEMYRLVHREKEERRQNNREADRRAREQRKNERLLTRRQTEQPKRTRTVVVVPVPPPPPKEVEELDRPVSSIVLLLRALSVTFSRGGVGL